MKISIVIPCYNVESYIGRCIESILNQTYMDFELLLIDDGSYDKTKEICELYLTKDIRISYYYQKNKGVSAARNLGIKKATGSKIMFVDADDYVDQNILSNLVQVINEKESLIIPICGMYHVKKEHISKNNNYLKLIEKNNLELEGSEVLTLFRYENLSTPCCKLYDISVLRKYAIVFNENITYQEDLIFNLDYFMHIQKIILVPEFSYFYIENPTSSSIKYHEHLFDSLPILFQKIKAFQNYSEHLESIKVFFLNQILNNLNNINHLASNLKFNDKYNQVKRLLNSSIFNFCQSSLQALPINLVLKKLIQLKMYRGIILFYNMHKFIK